MNNVWIPDSYSCFIFLQLVTHWSEEEHREGTHGSCRRANTNNSNKKSFSLIIIGNIRVGEQRLARRHRLWRDDTRRDNAPSCRQDVWFPAVTWNGETLIRGILLWATAQPVPSRRLMMQQWQLFWAQWWLMGYVGKRHLPLLALDPIWFYYIRFSNQPLSERPAGTGNPRRGCVKAACRWEEPGPPACRVLSVGHWGSSGLLRRRKLS